jgi:hypothetical protein
VPGTLTNVVFSNIRASGGTLASSITGLPGHPLRGITLRDVVLTMAGDKTEPFAGLVPEAAGDYPHAPMFGPLPASVLYVRHVDGLTLVDVRLRVTARDVRPSLVLDDVAAACATSRFPPFGCTVSGPDRPKPPRSQRGSPRGCSRSGAAPSC